jgi:uncharacterized protein (UPF0333 family)
MLKLRKNNSRGQSALEYALVIGVIVVGVIFAGRKIFGQKDSVAEKLMQNAVQEAQKTMTNPGE